eukprot:jgi/Ulvmu1/2494/UM137_0020.1
MDDSTAAGSGGEQTAPVTAPPHQLVQTMLQSRVRFDNGKIDSVYDCTNCEQYTDAVTTFLVTRFAGHMLHSSLSGDQ